MKGIWLCAIILLFVSCHKDYSCEGCQPQEGLLDAVIIYTGPVQSDGCDWMVKVGTDHYYHPDVLADAFKQNDLAVKIRFQLKSDLFFCGFVATGIPVIHLLTIRKQ
jgi:hypothetical protein